MNYGYFDEKNREYVITRPDTPAPWANYLGSPEYGALISNNAGGYSFVQSGANGRILRYVFDESDKPGRYIYLRDNDARDYWSASWQPVGKPLDQYKTECRHGLGYTVITSEYSQVRSTVCYYVPDGATYEVWNLKVKNLSDRKRSLTVTAYAEFTNNSNYEQDLVNLQYSRYITSTEFHENRIRQLIHGNLVGTERAGMDRNDLQERFLGLAGQKVSSYCGERDLFLGKYHTYANPAGVENGDLGNTLGYNDYCSGALSGTVTLAPGEEARFTFLLGMKRDEEAAAIVERYQAEDLCEKEIEELKALWEERLGTFQIHTPCPEFDTMINTWNAYNCFMTFIWSRAASFTYCGLRNGYGYRDTVQDIQGVIHLAPEMAAEKIRFMLSAQVDNGAGLPLVKFTHNPGHEDTPDDASYVKETGHPAYRADDALWLFPTVYKYIAESGNLDFLQEVIPYANKDSDTVYEHLKRAIRFSLEHMGPHGMPAGLHADWNDCLRLGKNGESTFVAFQFCYAIKIMKQFAEKMQDQEYIAFLDEQLAKEESFLLQECWDEDRFIRGYTEDGRVIGKREDAEANMWLNPQSWAVISGTAGEEKAEKAMDSVYSRLNTPYGAILMDPPYKHEAFEGALMVIFNAGVKENAGIFSQSQGWLVLSEALLGHGDRAFGYWSENAPSMQNDRAEIRILEPYCYGQFTEGKASPNLGRSHVHWLTGTASTMMVGSVEGILGMRPDLYGLKIAPSIPSKWDSLSIDKVFRGKKLHINIQNPEHKQSGFARLVLNGEELSEGYIPADKLKEENEIMLVI